MINEGGKWAHVVLRKCVFEPKAVGMSSLMHQPSTGHLRSTVCCAVSSVPMERRCIDSPETLIHSHSPCFTFFPSFLSHFYPVCSFMSFMHFFHTSFVSFNYPFLPLFFPHSALFLILHLSSSSFLTSFLHYTNSLTGFAHTAQ